MDRLLGHSARRRLRVPPRAFTRVFRMASIDTVVQTGSGPVRGVKGRRGRRGTLRWLGIPYAEAPVGDRRWRAPEPVTPWPEVLDCDRFGPAPMQNKLFTARMDGRFQPRSEDCLTLNIFAPETVPATPRPVMVFNYGGAYILGGTSTPIYDGSYLARARDVIVVTVNYRYSAFGFLDLSGYSTPDRPYDVNCGLKDMIAGLTWVQENIAAFGGDPDRVTVFGESAGGSAVLTLLSTPSAGGLFSRAIAQSPAPDLTVSQDDARLLADEFVRQVMDPARRVGAERTEPPLEPEVVNRALSSASSEELLAASNRLIGFANKAELGSVLPFAPVIDGDVVPLPLLDAAKVGATHRVPLIIGSNKDEGELFAKFWAILPDETQTLVGIEDPDIREEIHRLYPGTRDHVKLSADATFWVPTVVFARRHAEHSPTYLYRFDYAPRLLKLSGIGATHATELLAIFGTYRDPLGVGLAVAGSWKSTRQITSVMQSMWSWFAHTGEPAPDWPRYSRHDRRVMILDVPPRVVDDPDGARRRAWERVHEDVVE